MEFTGDTDLIGTARGWGIGDVVLATVTAGVVRAAGIGVDHTREVEIGSISKGVTGLLYEDAITRGEVTRETTLAQSIPALADAPAAAVTLDSLATQRSGLPRLPPHSGMVRRTIELLRHGSNPYGETLPELIDQTRATPLSKKPRPLYSNLGFEVLGHAVAARADLSFAQMLEVRIAQPLTLASMYAPATPGDLRPTAMLGSTRRGHPREAWVGEAIAPAGGIRANVTDMARLAVALLDGSAPGAEALLPRQSFVAGMQIGSAWVTSPLGAKGSGRSMTWHNGGTGGFRSFLGLDRESQTAVVVVSPRSVSVDRHAAQLLASLS